MTKTSEVAPSNALLTLEITVALQCAIIPLSINSKLQNEEDNEGTIISWKFLAIVLTWLPHQKHGGKNISTTKREEHKIKQASITQPTITYSKLTIEILEQGVKYAQS